MSDVSFKTSLMAIIFTFVIVSVSFSNFHSVVNSRIKLRELSYFRKTLGANTIFNTVDRMEQFVKTVDDCEL